MARQVERPGLRTSIDVLFCGAPGGGFASGRPIAVTTRYELFERIGVGGMAEIFRGKAIAPGGFEKPVAIKRILPHLAQDKRFVELLIAEAKVLSLLKHRNIVQIFDVGLGDDGKYFLVMEYVDGKDIGAIQAALETRRRRIPFDLCLHIGAEICEALEHAHSARAPDGKSMALVHRDVSPSNVLLSRAGETKLTDFGIAKRAEQESTGHHAVRGKFAYISPEQARNEHVDPRSDVFSVGILLWELVTGRRLFSGLGDLEALRAVRDARVTPPSELDSRLPREVDALLLSALSPVLAERPTAGQFGAKLRSLRYSLETTVGDPATELSKILDTVEEVARESLQIQAVVPPLRADPWSHDNSEATVIRIATADAFSMRDRDGASISRARQVIDRFEEEETRLAQLSSEQLQALRGRRDSSELSAMGPAPLPLPGVRSRRGTDEPTTARAPIDVDADRDERTRIVTSPRHRTPMPTREPGPPRAAKGPTLPPPVPPQALAPPPALPPAPVAPPPPPPLGMQVAWGMGPPAGPPLHHGIPPRATTHGAAPYPGEYPVFPNGMPPQLPAQAFANVASHYPPRAATPTMNDAYDAPRAPQQHLPPNVSGFARERRPLLQPWMLVVGAMLMAALAFAITRLFLS